MGTKNLARTVIEGGRASYCKTHYRIENQGERPASKKRLSTSLQAKGFKPTKAAGARGLSGLRLRMEIPADRGARDDHYGDRY